MRSAANVMLAALTALFAGPVLSAQDVAAERQRMVDTQLRAEGIRDDAVLRAMAKVPRHLFVPQDLRPRAYENTPLPIGLGQTISQPFIVAYMTEALQVRADHTILEIGTGSGYQAAVLAELAKEVLSIEIVPELAERARTTLADAEYSNVTVRAGNGYLGWPERAPFQRIIVTAAPETIPQALVDQLAVGGIMVVPVGTANPALRSVETTAAGIVDPRLSPVRFGPMTGKPGN